MKIEPGFTDKERMARSRCAEVLIHRQRIVDRAGGQLSVKADFWIDIGIKVESQAITDARVLLMRQSGKAGGRGRIGPAKDSVKAQPKVAAEAKRPDRQNLVLEFLYAIFKRSGLSLRRRRTRRRREFFLIWQLLFAACLLRY